MYHSMCLVGSEVRNRLSPRIGDKMYQRTVMSKDPVVLDIQMVYDMFSNNKINRTNRRSSNFVTEDKIFRVYPNRMLYGMTCYSKWNSMGNLESFLRDDPKNHKRKFRNTR